MIQIPEYLSREAKAALKEYISAQPGAPLPAPDDMRGWAKLHRENEAIWEKVNRAVVREYGPKISRREMGGVPVLEIWPKDYTESPNVLVYVHGGGYTMGSVKSSLVCSVPVANDTGLRVISVEYTVAPRGKWQKATDQVVAVLEALSGDGLGHAQIAIYGDSAGGGLAAGSVLKMRDQGMEMPGVVVLWSPWSDITETGDSYHTLRSEDPLLDYALNLKNSADAYADPEDQKHPYVSPVYGDYSRGFPPTQIQGGTKEIFLSNFIRHYQALDDAGIPARLDLYD
ncbi:MAG: alpha/beta hydrolase, partial [Bacteroidota bacterium]